MYNQTYEEYMRNVLGYIPQPQDMEYTYRNDQNMMYYNPMPMNQYVPSPNMSTCNTESMYPDIYRIVYPMVRKACANYQGEVTEENVEKITMEIFTNVEAQMDISMNTAVTQNRKVDTKTEVKSANASKIAENRNQTESRQRNFLLQDLIRILVLRELLGGNRPHRPPFPGPGPRPPFSSGPIRPRNYNENGMFY